MGQIALSPAFRTLDTHDLRRGLRVKSPKQALRTRLPQKLTRQSLQNERFVRDFLQKSSANTIKHPSEHTSRSPAKQFRDSSPLTRQSQCDSDIHLYHNYPQLTTSRFPAPATKCHLPHTLQPHDSLRLPRESHFHTSKPARSPAPATKSDKSSHVSFNKICTTPHVWNDFDPFRAHSHPPKSPFQLRLVTKTKLRCHTLKRKSQLHGHIQHPKNTTLQTLIPMELRSNLRISQNAAPVQRNASRFLRDMPVSCKSQWNSGAN